MKSNNQPMIGVARKLLIFGSGFIASSLAIEAKNNWGWQVKVVYRNYQNPALSEFDTYYMPNNQDDLLELLEDYAPTDILLAMGSSYVPAINSDLNKSLDEHLQGPLLALNCLTRISYKLSGKILIIGSASEYGQFSDKPIDESFSVNPIDRYGLIKAALQNIGQYYSRFHALPIIHLRQFNVTGIGQNKHFVVPSICSQIAAIPLGSLDRHPIIAGNVHVRRDFLAISDVCMAYGRLFMMGEPGEIYNVSSGDAYLIEDLIILAGQLSNIHVYIEKNQSLIREGDKVQPIILGDSSKLKRLGWEPKTRIDQLLQGMIASYRTSLMF